MSVFYLSVSLLLSLILTGIVSEEMPISNKIQVIKAFLDAKTTPTYPTVFNCWPKAVSKDLLKSCSTKYGGTVLRQTPRLYPPHFDAHHQLFIADLDCDNSTIFLEQMNVYFSAPYSWFIIGTSTFEKFKKISDRIEFLPDSNVVIAEKQVNVWIFKEAYKVYYSGPVVLTEYGRWDGEKLLEVPVESIAMRRRNLKQALIRSSIVYINNDSLNHLTNHKYPGVEPVTKMGFILLQVLLDSINASRSYTYINTWGYRIAETNQYTGLIGELQRNISDIGGTPLFMTIDRIPIIEYLSPLYPSQVFFIFRAPPLSSTSNILTLPFNPAVWRVETLLLIFMTGCLFLAMQWEKSKLQLGDIVMVSVAAISQQGSNLDPKMASGRATSFILFVALMFLFMAWSAKIVVLLQSTSDSIKTLQDLLDSDIELGSEDLVYNKYYFKTATEPLQNAIYKQKMIQSNGTENFIPLEEGIRKVRKGFYAFHAEGNRMYLEIEKTFMEHEKCDLKHIKYLPVTFPWLAIQKRSPYMEILKIELKKIHERGFQSREARIFLMKKSICTGIGANFSSVNLMDIAGAFYLILFGFVLSVAGLTIECLTRRLKQN